MNDIKTLILRFRDLVTEHGETISAHKAIIDQNKSVWWAWWRKGHEITPVSEFGILRTRANETGLQVMLVDSGQNKLYLAKCSEIIFQENTPMKSPDSSLTPEYYQDRKYFAWFNFTSIEECAIDEVRNYTYANSNALFAENEANYNMFNDKIIFSTKELIQQNRTIWFVRDFKPGDKEQEITLLNSSVVQPNIFSEKYKELNGSTFLWLSDLHFSNDVLTVKTTPNNASLTSHIKAACDEGNCFSDISSLIISGDVTNCGKQEGFESAKDFLVDINRELFASLDSDSILICPGNHDIKRIEQNHPDTKEPILFNDNLEVANNYIDLFKSIYHIKPNDYLCCGRKMLTKSGKTVEIVAINSIMLQQYKNYEGHGYISQEQLDCIEKGMGWGNNDNASYRIAVMHHHYCPACLFEKIEYTKPSSVVYDADRLMLWLVKNNVKMLLHGHKHNTFFTKVSYPKCNGNKYDINDLHEIYVLSTGGTGSKDTDNKFSTLTFDNNKIIWRIFKINPNQITSNILEQKIIIPIN